MLDLFDQSPTSEAVGYITAGLTEVRRKSLKARIEAMEKAHAHRSCSSAHTNKVMANEYSDLVTDRLAARYDTETFAEMKLQSGVMEETNVLNDVLDKADKTWSAGATYTLVQGGKPLTDNDNFTRFMRVADFDAVARRCSRLLFVHPGVYVMPEVVWCPRIGKRRFTHVILTPDNFCLLPSATDPADYEALVIYSQEGDCEYRTVWLSDRYAVYERTRSGVGGQWSEWQMVGGVQENIYGRIPGVFFRNDPFKLWGDHFGKVLREATLEACCAHTLQNYMMSGQVKFILGMLEKFPAGQRLGHGRVVNTGQAEQIVIADMQTNVEAFSKVYIKDRRSQAAVSVGLRGDEWDKHTDTMSGEALKMLYWDRDQLAIARREWLVPLMVQLYWMDLCVLHAHMTHGYMDDGPDRDPSEEPAEPSVLPIDGFDDGWKPGIEWQQPDPKTVLPPYDEDTHAAAQGTQLVIDPNEITYPQLANERRETEEYELEKGFVSLPELMRTRNPDLTQDQAIETMSMNKDLNAQVLGVQAGQIDISALEDLKLAAQRLQPSAADAVLPPLQQQALDAILSSVNRLVKKAP